MYCSNSPLSPDSYDVPGMEIGSRRMELYEHLLDAGLARKCLRVVTDSEEEQDTLEAYVAQHGGHILFTSSFMSGVGFSTNGSMRGGATWFTTVLFPNEEEVILAKLTLA